MIKYAEDLGVTILYENCPMPEWCETSNPFPYNNLPATLAARKMMYLLVESGNHGETYDPSHDIWQFNDPVKVVEFSDMDKIRRVHVKSSVNVENSSTIHWGRVYPKMEIDEALAKKAGVPTRENSRGRYQFKAVIPGFGEIGDLDWNKFINKLAEKRYNGPFVIENEGFNSAGTNNLQATKQGINACVEFLKPLLWPLKNDSKGYEYDNTLMKPLENYTIKDIPVVSYRELEK